MKAMVCEMCGSNDIVKQDGLYVCQHCGTKYTVEEAKKLMFEGAVDVSGSIVKLDTTDELNNLYELARRAKNNNNTENARKYYEQILIKDPSSWEASFYSIYYQSLSTNIAGISLAASQMMNAESDVLHLIKSNILDPDEQKRNVIEVAARCKSLGEILFHAAKNHYMEIDYSVRLSFFNEFTNRAGSSINVISAVGDHIASIFGDIFAKDISVPCWNACIALNQELLIFCNKTGKQTINRNIQYYKQKICKYDPSLRGTVVKAKQQMDTFTKDPEFIKQYKRKGGAIVFLIFSIAFLYISFFTFLGFLYAYMKSGGSTVGMIITSILTIGFAVMMVFSIINMKKVNKHNADLIKTYREKEKQEKKPE